MFRDRRSQERDAVFAQLDTVGPTNSVALLKTHTPEHEKNTI